MTRSKRHQGHPDDYRSRITLAVIAGLIAGATRTVLDTLLHHLTASC